MSILLIKDGDVYAPKHHGKKDILIINEKIVFIDRNISISGLKALDENMKTINASDCFVIPGHIDQHVHISGAGGEGGPQYRTPPIQLSEFVKAGITSVGGVLGTDGFARSLKALLMKARALEQEGISTWIYTGAYEYPSPTMTGSILSDIVLIDKVIGLKIALSDHRASHPTLEEFSRATSEARSGGVIAGKAGIVHIHLGGEKQGLGHLFDLIQETDIPVEQFAPTHCNKKDEELFKQIIAFGKIGGYIDLTAGTSEKGSDEEMELCNMIRQLLQQGISLEQITISSDGNGSLPSFNEKKEFVGMRIASVSTMHETFINMIKKAKFSLEETTCMTSTNIATHLKLSQKGTLKVGKDADILIMRKESLAIEHVIARGKMLMENGKVVRFGTFEKR